MIDHARERDIVDTSPGPFELLVEKERDELLVWAFCWYVTSVGVLIVPSFFIDTMRQALEKRLTPTEKLANLTAFDVFGGGR